MSKQVSVAEIYIVCKDYVTPEEAEELAKMAKKFLVSHLREEREKDIFSIYSTTYTQVFEEKTSLQERIITWLTKLFK